MSFAVAPSGYVLKLACSSLEAHTASHARHTVQLPFSVLTRTCTLPRTDFRLKRTKVNGGAVEVAETFLKALPEEPGEQDVSTEEKIILLPTDSAPVPGDATNAAASTTEGLSIDGSALVVRQPVSKTKPPKRFLPIALITEERASALRDVLREMLIEFLQLCRLLVLKTRTVLNVPKHAPVVAPRAVGEERTIEEVRKNRVFVVVYGFTRVGEREGGWRSEGWDRGKATVKSPWSCTSEGARF